MKKLDNLPDTATREHLVKREIESTTETGGRMKDKLILILQTILIIIAVMLSTYLLAALIEWNWDWDRWDITTRQACCVAVLMFSIFFALMNGVRRMK